MWPHAECGVRVVVQSFDNMTFFLPLDLSIKHCVDGIKTPETSIANYHG